MVILGAFREHLDPVIAVNHMRDFDMFVSNRGC